MNRIVSVILIILSSIGVISGENNLNSDWLAGEWCSYEDDYFYIHATISKEVDKYYVKLSNLFNHEVLIANTNKTEILFDGNTGYVNYEDNNGNKGKVKIELNEKNRDFTLEINETTPINGSSIERLWCTDDILKMKLYNKGYSQDNKNYSGKDEFEELIIFLQKNIWKMKDNTNKTWAFVPGRMSLGDGVLYENNNAIGTFCIYEKGEKNTLQGNIKYFDKDSLKEINITFEKSIMKIDFPTTNEQLIFR